MFFEAAAAAAFDAEDETAAAAPAATAAPAAVAVPRCPAPWQQYIDSDEEMSVDNEDAAAAPAAAAPAAAKRAKIDTIDERWELRVMKSTIAADLARGCGRIGGR